MQRVETRTTSAVDTSPLSARYELVNVFELPSIRIHRSIKSVIFTKRGLQRFNAFTTTFNRPLLLLYTLSLPLDLAVLLAHESIGKWFAVVKLLCQLPMLLLGTCSLRVDMLQRLVRTYEFWFFSTMNLANCAAISVYYGDLRALSAISYWLAIQMNICVDANIHTHQFAGTSVLAILYQLCLLLTVSLQLTPHTHTMTVLKYRLHSMTSNDVLVNTVGTTAILMVRTAYRKRQNAKRRMKTNSSAVQCVSYRCRVKLQLKEDASLRTDSSSHNKSKSRGLSSAAVVLALQQLRFASQGTVFDDDDVVWPRAVRFLRPITKGARRQKLIVLYSSGALGLAANLVPFIWKHFAFTRAQFTALWAFGLACPIGYVVSFFCFYNRRLLRELVFSFDFCFLSAHLTVVHLFVCDVFIWDARCFTVFVNWLAVHWVLTLDALTPLTRRRLGLRIRFVMPVVGFVVLCIMRMSLDQIVFKPSKPVQDHVLWQVRVLDHTLEFRIVPFILNRAWTILLWCIRLLWRLATSGEDDRLILQGNVEFATSSATLDRRDGHASTLRNLLVLPKRSWSVIQPASGAP